MRKVGSVADGDEGALSVLLLLLLLATTFLGTGSWGLMRHWRHLMELQLRLDRCVGHTALELKRVLGRIETSNRRLRLWRAAQAATILAAAPPGQLRGLMGLEVARQDLERLGWQARQIRWITSRGCDGLSDLPIPLPTMEWVRPPPDVLGPQPLVWERSEGVRLKLELAHVPRAAAALVQRDGGGIKGGFWKAAWSAPGLGRPGLVRPGLD